MPERRTVWADAVTRSWPRWGVASVLARHGGAVGGAVRSHRMSAGSLAAGVDQHEFTLTRRRSCRDPVRLSFGSKQGRLPMAVR